MNPTAIRSILVVVFLEYARNDTVLRKIAIVRPAICNRM
jgi:hypothetical protein